MTITILFPFPLINSGGKNRAALQKSEALLRLYPDAIVLYPKRKNALIIDLFCIEIYAIYLLITGRSSLLWSRGYIGSLATVTAFILGKPSIREIHSKLLEEIRLLDKSFIEKALLRFCACYSLVGDLFCQLLVFNTIQLKKTCKYRRIRKLFSHFISYPSLSIVSYNAGTSSDFHRWADVPSLLSERRAFAADDQYILTFSGSVSPWHGVDYIVKLAKYSLDRGFPYKYVIVGGKISAVDKLANIINVSPSCPAQSHRILSISDAFLLPVKPNRSSPGSPLKLYDYLNYDKPIFYQDGTSAYVFEASGHPTCFSVDFLDPDRFLDTLTTVWSMYPPNIHYPKLQNFISLSVNHTWDHRVISILSFLNLSLSQ